MDMQARGGQQTSVGDVGTGLSRGIGVFSIGLGLAEIAAPRSVARLIGILPDGRTRGTMRALGAREIAHGVGILSKPAHPLPLWARVAGDVLDLALLGWALRTRARRTDRLIGAAVAVAGVAALDVIAGQRLARSRRGEHAPRRTKIAAITINRPQAEVRARWRELAADLENIVNVEFRPAPGGRGTEVRVELAAQRTLEKAFGRIVHTDVEQLADGDLRKIKQLIELGEIVHSDASIHRGMHSAQPTRRSHKPQKKGA